MITETTSGNRGLLQAEALIFESGHATGTGVDLPAPKGTPNKLGGLGRKAALDLPGFSEPETMRHFVRLSQKNYAIDLGLFPLGSCTMKHNPRLNERAARFEGFADLHPLQPTSTIQGALELMEELAHWLCTLTGMPAVALSPKAGAHGEFCGMLAIKAALEARGEGDKRKRVLVPSSAHGTNPATAAAAGFTVDEIPARDDGRVHLDDVKAKLGPDVAAIMITNPNTCGLFEPEIKRIADAIHEAGAYFYCDGANYNAIVGKVRPGDLGIDAMHINLHKTFSTPHGGGGPGAGPTVLSEALAPFAPLPLIVIDKTGGKHQLAFAEHVEELAGSGKKPFGRMCAFHGQMGMFTRALTYMMSHGSDGLRQVAEDAVLNANYLLARLKPHFNAPFGERPCMHEVLLDDSSIKPKGVETIDMAKALLDEGYHPFTTYFPLVVHGAMLIEPTETEPKRELDRFADVMIALAERVNAGEVEFFKQAPKFTPMRRLDDTRAARQPKLRWKRGDNAGAAKVAAE
ncbi:aminomethyl-transferring glycine dehydrogenase subunit GcvPB [Terricaulis sp.]|uniref:aminomethyl-transferring glycine dehydrogenase subunit GcvPB n=1 Tax=Terricaulis sp. TaxID=2768686 RepID=UPI002AC3A071|nr:aminomethyl-transferring glycine dehydrogenase subunit GcvPB [Terricaulis sp.]MDZ4692132.1 aminomethyl-transferring glycine dehydrogenase subunit GcvPB [Terricaulis sp.]